MTALELKNLDCASKEDLEAFLDAVGTAWSPGRAARELFPERPPGFIKVTRRLRQFALYKLSAIQWREMGRIVRAMEDEEICDDIYLDLPEWARW